MRNVTAVPGEGNDVRLLLLNKEITDLSLAGLPDDLKEWALSEGATPMHHEVVARWSRDGYEVVSRRGPPRAACRAAPRRGVVGVSPS